MSRSAVALAVAALLALVGLVAYFSLSGGVESPPTNQAGRPQSAAHRGAVAPPEVPEAHRKTKPSKTEGVVKAPAPPAKSGVAGLVLGPDGKPVVGAEVYTAAADAVSLLAKDVKSAALTDKAGRFQLDLPPGTIDLVAYKSGLRPGIRKDVDVSKGRMTDAGTIQLDAGRSLSGQVVDTDGQAVFDVEVLAVKDPTLDLPAFLPARATIEDWGGTAATREDGTFRITGLGRDSLYVLARRWDIVMVGKPKSYAPGATDIRIVVKRLRVATGRIVSEGKEEEPGGISGATVRLDVKTSTFEQWFLTKTDGSGRFVFDLSSHDFDDPKMKLAVRVTATGFQDGAKDGLSLDDLKTAAKFELSLVPAPAQQPGRLKGRVVYDTGEPFDGTLTLSFTQQGEAGNVYQVKTDKNGDFLLTGIPPGTYTLRSAPRDSLVLQETGQKLDIPPGGEATTEFTLTRGGDLEVDVTTSSGQPPEGAQVSLLSSDGEVTETVDAKKGAAQFFDLAPGTAKFRVTAPGYQTATGTAQIVKDQGASARVMLQSER